MKSLTNNCLFLLCFILTAVLGMGCQTRQTLEPPTVDKPTAKGTTETRNVLSPVYAPLAEWLVERFDLKEKTGIGIDLGSGTGDLIVELAQRTPGLHWINADIDPSRFGIFYEKAKAAGVSERVSAQWSDAGNMPYRDGYADIVVSRGSFPFWSDLKAGLSEVNRILKPGGIAYIGRGFSENLPVETAKAIRERQQTNNRFPRYDVDETEKELRRIMVELEIRGYEIIRPHPPGSEGVNYGIWLEWRK